ELVLQPDMQSFDDGPTSLLARLPSMISRMTAYFSLDRVEITDARQHLGGERRLRADVELVEAAPHVRPAECQLHRAVGPIADNPLEPVISVDLEHTLEPRQVPRRARGLAVLGIHVGSGRVRRAAPGP